MQANSVARVAKVVHSYIVDVGIDKVISWFIVSGQRKIIQWLRSRSIRNHSGSLRTPILWFFELESDEKDEYFESRYGKV